MTEIIVTSSVLILLVAVLRQVLRGRISPGVQYALWLLVAARLLIPGTLFTAPVSVVGAAESLRETTRWAAAVVTAPPSAAVQAPSDGGFTVFPQESADKPSASPAPIGAPALPQAGDLLELIWKAGMAVTAGALVVSNLIFYLNLRNNRRRLDLPAAPWTGNLPVYEADGLPSPCLFGVFRPAVYLNEAAMDAAHPEHILAHEYAHYRHGDHLWSILRSVCLAVHWYNPLVWWAAALSRQDCELACDAAVLKRLGGEESIDYGQTLLSMVSRGRTPAALLQTATTMSAGKRAMKERLALIVKQPKMRKITLALVALLTVCLAACAFGRAVDAPSEPADEMPLAVTVSQVFSSYSGDTSLITDPDEVARLWELYQSFVYEGTYDPTGMGGWFVTVDFQFGDGTDGASDVYFILTQHGVHTQDRQDLLLQNIEEIYNEFLRVSTSNPILPAQDPTGEIMANNARTIVEMIQQDKDASEWLPLMNYMDWGAVRQALVEAGMDNGDGSGAAVESVMGGISRYIELHSDEMTNAEYLYILTATAGLDGALTSGYTYILYRMYVLGADRMAYVVLEMLPEAQRDAVLDLLRSEQMFQHEFWGDAVPDRETVAAQLKRILLADSIYASPHYMTLDSAGATFQFQVFNVPGIYALTYTSSDPGVASVDENGVVTAAGPGSAAITAHCEGGGGTRDFTCNVTCAWDSPVPLPADPVQEPQDAPAAASSAGSLTDLPAELTNSWQREFAGGVLEIPAMPDRELIYDDMGDGGLEQAVLAALSDYYRTYIAQNGASRFNDRFSHMILESAIPAGAAYGETVTVYYQAAFLRDQVYEGKTYTLAAQPGEHLSTTFTVMPQSVVMGNMLAGGAMGQLDGDSEGPRLPDEDFPEPTLT